MCFGRSCTVNACRTSSSIATRSRAPIVNLAGGYAVLKDISGATQYLLIPTTQISGIEDPALLAPLARNYFADAWQARGFVEKALGHAMPRDMLSLAINSESGARKTSSIFTSTAFAPTSAKRC